MNHHELSRRDVLRGAVGLTALSYLSSCGASGSPPRKRRPNVLFLLSDGHRSCSVGCYGDQAVRTPHIDGLARGGVRLAHAVSNTPQCRPYRASLMTGSHAHRTGLVSNSSAHNFGVDGPQWTPGDLPTLGTHFARAGYRCGYIGKWHLGSVNTDPGPLRFGFDDHWIAARSPVHNYYDWEYATGKSRGIEGEGRFRTTAETDWAIEFLAGEAGRTDGAPWFLVVSWGPPHDPFKPPEPFDRGERVPALPNVPAEMVPTLSAEWLPRYYGMIEALDHELGRLVAEVDALGLADDTVVVYTSDHGIMIGSHGVGGKEWPYAASLQVPFVIRWPGVLPAGHVVESPFGAPDVFPTLAGLAGVEPPEDVQGLDFSAELRGATAPTREVAYLSAHDPSSVPYPGWRGVRTRRHLYARKERAPWLLFDVEQDRFELRNLVKSERGLRDELDDLLTEEMDRLGDGWRIL